MRGMCSYCATLVPLCDTRSPLDIWQFISPNSMLRLVTLWKQYEFRPHFSAIRLMCNYFFKRAVLLYLIPVFIYYSSTEEIFVIYDGSARIVLFTNEIYFHWIAFPLRNSKYTTYTRQKAWNELIFALCVDPNMSAGEIESFIFTGRQLLITLVSFYTKKLTLDLIPDRNCCEKMIS